MLVNFGKNVHFEPAAVVTPRNRNEVLACFVQHPDKEIRAVGRLHSWSQLPVTAGVVLDLRHLNRIALHHLADGSVEAEVEAGATIGDILDYLQAHGGFALPTIGMIRAQTIAGAIATATHGAGRASLSHYVRGMTVAAFNPDGSTPAVYEWYDGPMLEAARCHLGCLGIVLAVRIRVERERLLEERTRWTADLEDLLRDEHSYPRQQMYLVPWTWRWFAQQRRELPEGVTRVPLAAYGFRALRFILADVMLNGVVRLLAQRGWLEVTQWHFRQLFPRLVREGMRTIDAPAQLLTMRHDLYTHVEMELYVRAGDVLSAAALVQWILRTSAGDACTFPAEVPASAVTEEERSTLQSLTPRYVHDHPITVRKVLPDAAMMSMTSGDEHTAWYAFSFATYQPELGPFMRTAGILARSMMRAYGARPHWGKVCPLDAGEIARLYPRLPEFRHLCTSVDPRGVFVNDFSRDKLGFEAPSRPS